MCSGTSVSQKRSEALIPATVWASPESMVSEISQTLKDRYCMISLFKVPTVGEFLGTEDRRAVIGAGEGRTGE